MPGEARPDSTIRFGTYEVDLHKVELCKNGARIRIQEQPFKVLAALLERPGEVVSREDLVRRLWPDGTYVDFDRGLNAAVTRLRQVLSDSAEQPRYVETVPGRGYRFVGRIEEAVPGSSPPAKPRRRFWPALLAIALASGAGFIWLPKREAPSKSSANPVPLTSYPGTELTPNFSPDGSQVAFVWDRSGVYELYIKVLGSSDPLQLTSAGVNVYGPSWSRDGRQIAFIRRLDSSTMGVYAVPALGGPERRLGQFKLSRFARTFPMTSLVQYTQRWIDWTPDGEHLVFSGADDNNDQQGLFLLSLESGDRKRLTGLPASVEVSYLSPAVSPDGRSVAFCRMSALGFGELWTAPIDGREAANAVPRVLTSDARFCTSPAWTPSGRHIVISSTRIGGDFGLLKVAASGGSVPERIAAAGTGVAAPAVSKLGQLAYERRVMDVDIWRQELPQESRSTLPPPVSLITSTAIDHAAHYSPDGTRIAFQSWRSGNPEIWVCSSDGDRCVQLTNTNGPHTGSPSWSPDGKWIAFDGASADSFDIYVVDANGGRPRRLTDDLSSDAAPSWSTDGKWIYFMSMRTGTSQIWKLPATGGSALPVTRDGGSWAMESPDGRFLFYTKPLMERELFQSALDGSGETKVADRVLPRAFAVSQGRLYFLRSEPSGQVALRRINLNTGEELVLSVLAKSHSIGFSVSPNGRYLIYSQVVQEGSDLMLLDGFK
jgi:Tol biopolymer transport system component/DNA-binding winged helix-turn-helix (wHTH) protein